MIRSCKLCGAQKSSADPGYDKDLPSDKFWAGLHAADCPYPSMKSSERMDYFMENGSPLSSVSED